MVDAEALSATTFPSPSPLGELGHEGAGGLMAPRPVADHPKVAIPTPPAFLAAAWTNVNTPESLSAQQGEG